MVIPKTSGLSTNPTLVAGKKLIWSICLSLPIFALASINSTQSKRINRRIKPPIFIILVSLLLIKVVQSQTLHVVGNVSTDSTPVSYASITFTDEGDPSKYFSTITDTVGNYQLDIITSIEEDPLEPKTFELGQNYTNPFSSETEIPYKINRQSNVSIKIYNILGQEVRTFNIGLQTNGIHGIRWDGRNNFGDRVTPGIYFYQLQAGNETHVKKMIFKSSSPNFSFPFAGKVTFDDAREINKKIIKQTGEYMIKIINGDCTTPRITTRVYRYFKIQYDTSINFNVQEALPSTDIFGTITKNDSPFYISGPARVPKGKTLTIEPGVTILFRSGDVENHNECDYDWSDSTVDIGFLGVDGKLIAEGTNTDSIIFTRDSSIDNYYWGCIYFSETADSNSIISFSKVEYASLIYEIESKVIGEGITCWFSSIIIQNSFIKNFKEFGICLQNSETLVKNNIIRNCIVGIDTWTFDELAYLQPVIRNNIIIKNTHHGITIGKPRTIVENNVICYNDNVGLYLGFELLGRSKVINNIIYGNKNFQVKIDSFYVPDPDITYSDIENGWFGEGNINKNPKFIDPANENFHLLPDSPCINSGSPLQQYNDLDGSRNDMGAYGGPYGDW